MIVEIQISELKVGHFVVSIGKQQGTFTLTNSAHIKSDKVINNLKSKGVQSVSIDTSKTLNVNNTEKPVSTNKEKVIVELKKAKQIFSQSKLIQQKVFADAQHGLPLDLSPVLDITDKTIDTIFENSDALACVINIRNKDEYLLEHSVSVSVLMTIFARFLDIDKAIIQELSLGAFLHDVGKIMIPPEILNKPGKLTDEEFTIMKSHVNHSIEIIKRTPEIPALSLEVAALHHEKLDGNGYPFNVKGDDITQYGRMIAICDIFDALTANRCYKEGFSHIKSFSILRSLGQNNHLDATLVDQFIKCMGVYPVGTLVELGSNKLAIVESRNINDPTNPVVRSFYDAEEHKYEESQDIDLSNEEDFIVKGVKPDDFNLDMNKIMEFLLMEG
jgi:HD-GYP domain-containing protein (c-di-GMP phosphodiesterase class II)